MKNIGDFYLKIFSFLEVKLSIYLNRRVFVMRWELYSAADPSKIFRVCINAKMKSTPVLKLKMRCFRL